VNPNVDGYTKTPNPKYQLCGAWFLHLAGQESQIAPLPSRQLFHCNKHSKY